jgi:hypothetical protein
MSREAWTPGATKPGFTVADPACGTGGFLLAAHDYMEVAHAMAQASFSTIRSHLLHGSRDIRASLHIKHATSKKEQRHLKEHALRGNDIVDSVVRLCAIGWLLGTIAFRKVQNFIFGNKARNVLCLYFWMNQVI